MGCRRATFPLPPPQSAYVHNARAILDAGLEAQLHRARGFGYHCRFLEGAKCFRNLGESGQALGVSNLLSPNGNGVLKHRGAHACLHALQAMLMVYPNQAGSL